MVVKIKPSKKISSLIRHTSSLGKINGIQLTLMLINQNLALQRNETLFVQLLLFIPFSNNLSVSLWSDMALSSFIWAIDTILQFSGPIFHEGSHKVLPSPWCCSFYFNRLLSVLRMMIHMGITTWLWHCMPFQVSANKRSKLTWTFKLILGGQSWLIFTWRNLERSLLSLNSVAELQMKHKWI